MITGKNEYMFELLFNTDKSAANVANSKHRCSLDFVGDVFFLA